MNAKGLLFAVIGAILVVTLTVVAMMGDVRRMRAEHEAAEQQACIEQAAAAARSGAVPAAPAMTPEAPDTAPTKARSCATTGPATAGAQSAGLPATDPNAMPTYADPAAAPAPQPVAVG